jgi:hypothetical protein
MACAVPLFDSVSLGAGMPVSSWFERESRAWAQAVLSRWLMLTGRTLGMMLVLIGLIVMALSAFVIYFSTSPH